MVLGAASGTSRADWAQALLTLGSRRGAKAQTVSQIADAPLGSEPADLTESICEGGRGLALKPVAQAKGYGVSLGQFEKRDDGLKVLRLWSDSGDTYLREASKGLAKLSNSKNYTALVWDLDEGEARSLCAFIEERGMDCEVDTPDRIQTLADSAKAAAAKPSPPRKKGKKRKRKKKG